MYASTIHLPLEQQLSLAMRTFTRVRWVPPIVIVLGGAFFKAAFGLPISLSALTQIAAGIVVCNGYLWWRDKRLNPGTIAELLRFAGLQMFLDFLAITALVHYTGGVLSPIVWFYSIHIVMACIFFKRPKVIRIVAFLWFILCVLFLTEYFGWLPHWPLFAPAVDGLYRDRGFIFGVLAGCAVLWAGLIWLTTMIIDRVRAAENEERELQVRYKRTMDELIESEKKRELYRRSMTHELRSPIAAAQSIIRIMGAGAFGPLGEKQQDGVRRVGVRLDQLMELLQDLLTIERAGRVEFQNQPVPLKAVVERTIEAYRPQIEERRLAVDLDLDPEAIALADPDDVKTVASNLISNAVKYNRDDGRLKVRASADDSRVRLAIADTGIGIPQKDRARLFTEFFRATNAKERTAHGTGLGLAIVRNMVRQNHGEVDVESVENVGTTITVTLPRATGEWLKIDSL
jgi:signal transduction histidine kinase